MNSGVDNELHDLFSALCDGAASSEQVDRIEGLLRARPAARRFYLRYMDLHARLMQHPDLRPIEASEQKSEVRGQRSEVRWLFSGYRPLAAALAVLVLVGVVVLMRFPSRLTGLRPPTSDLRPLTSAPCARLTVAECQWVDPEAAHQAGDTVVAGQRLELASGQVEIEFASGAKVSLCGPAIFEVQSGNSGYLTLGRLSARADTPQSRGFTVHSRTAATVDLGTEFTVVAADDGHSQIHVVEGAVEVQLSNGKAQRRLGVGQSIEVEPGSPSVIARIEPGEGTPAFKFPTIEPPSGHDYADVSSGHARICILRGRPHFDSGPVEVLLDGKGQPTSDSPRESFFFKLNDLGMILLDLGQKIPIKKVNTYSWHHRFDLPRDRTRATQKYYLYGSASAAPPPANVNPAAAGWTLIAQVNTDEFFGFPRASARPEQQAVSITATNGGRIGKFRYLLWDIRPTRADESASIGPGRAGTEPVYDNTFYGEFDVYREGH